MVSLVLRKYFTQDCKETFKCPDNELNSNFLILLFYFPECLDLGAICPCGRTEIVHEF